MAGMVDTHPKYVFELPAKVIFDLCMILDPGDVWEHVAVTMPDIGDIDIDACRRLRFTNERSSESLLKIWGSKGYTINDLFKVFGRLKMVKCMQIIRHLVDPELHCLEQECLCLPNSSPSPKFVSHHEAVNERSGSSYVRVSEQTQPSSSVYSKKTQQNSWSDLAEDTESEGSASVFSGLQNTLSVKYQEILQATDNFSQSNILGKGGYGTVYKGDWKHFEVAVKRIQAKKDGSRGSHDKEQWRQSIQELRTLAKFRHDNILSLYGYSLDGSEPCLVYQFMANGSLEDRLLCRRNTRPIPWKSRFRIAHGISCGLHFLHSISTAPVIHGDVKSANVLLDSHLGPKIGDFGLCRLGQRELDVDEKSPLIASHIKGTLAYLPPEFILSKILSTKLDVYSFGVVLLEIGSGLRAYSDTRTPNGLVDYTNKLLKENREGGDEKLANAFADKKCGTEGLDARVFAEFVQLALLCAHKDRLSRPTMSDVVMQLRGMLPSDSSLLS